MSFYEIHAEKRDYFYFQKRTEKITRAHFHGSIEFLFVENGSLTVTINGETKVLHAGEACFCDRFTVHSYASYEDSVSHVFLGEKEYFEPAFAIFNGKVPPKFFLFGNFSMLQALGAFCNARNAPTTAKIAFEGGVKLLLAEIAESTPFVKRNTSKHSLLVSDILRYADENLTGDLSLRAIAVKFGYSHEHLSRLLHRYLAENWPSFVNRLRLRRAESALREDPEANVLHIIYACGFDSPNTFYRAYKKEFGRTPKRIL